MVGIFTGLGSGLERGSARQLGAAGLLGSAAFGRSGEQLLLNAATGNVLIGASDEFLVGRGPDAAIARTYNSLGNAADENGDNWRQSTDRRIFGETGTRGSSGATVTRRSADGSEIVYTCNGSGVYVATDGDGAYDTLSYSSGTGYWTWTDGDTHSVETYEVTYASAAQWRLKQVADGSGNVMTLSYVASSDHLDKVTTADGGYIQYGWSGNNITQVVTHYTDLATSTAKTLTRVRYTYDGSNRLVTVTTDLTPEDSSVSDGAVYTATYTYDGSSTRVATIAESDGSSIAIGYDATSHKVTSITQTVASGVTRVTSVAYTSSTVTTITDPLGQATTLEYNSDGSLKKITAPPAVTGATAQTVQFTYDSSGNVLTVTDAAGAVTTYGGYTNGNWTTQTDALGNVVTRAYDANNNMTSETRIGDDNTALGSSHLTLYAYDSANRLVGVVSPRGLTTSYEYDSYGQLTRTIRDTTRNFFSLNSPTTLVTGSQYYSWLYGQVNRASWSSLTNTYDVRGNLLTTTAYGAIDNTTGNGIAASGYTTDSYSYDQAGRLLSHSHAGLNTEHFVYDGLGRMTAATDINGGTTSFVFTDSSADNSTRTVVTTAAGYVQTYTYNRAGDLISMTDSGAGVTGGTTSYQYDALGRVRVMTDANGNKSYTLYDLAGRKTADVDAYGFVREYRYDADNRLVATVRWTNAIGGANLTTLANPANTLDIATIRPASDAADIWSWTVYDADGNKVQTIEGDGSVTTYQYDASNQLVKTLIYANKLTSTQLSAIRTTAPATPFTPTASSDDSYSRVAYDKDGAVQGTVDFAGYISRNQYDNGERLTGTLVQSAKPDPSLAATSPFATLVNNVLGAGVSRSDHCVFDSKNRLQYTIDGLNHVTEYDYDEGSVAVDQPRRIIRYAGTIAPQSFYNYDTVPSAMAAAGLTATNPDNRISYTVYDAAGRAAYAIDADGAVTGYGYDSSGRLIKTVQYATLYSTSSLPPLATMASWASSNISANDRVSRTYYTSRGEVAYTIDGEGYVTGMAYDAKGQLLTKKLWDTPVSATDAWILTNVASAVSALTSTTTTYTYDLDGRVATMRDGAGHGHDYVYGGNGLLAWDIRMSGSSTDESKTKFVYDAAGRLTDRYDGWTSGSAATHYAYDGRGDQISVTDPNGKTTTRTFDGNGNVLTETDPTGGVTSFQYDSRGNVVKTTDPRGNSSYAYYDVNNKLVATRDAENYVTTTTYNGFGEVASVTRHSARATNAASTTLPTWTWDSTDVPVTTTYDYDKIGQRTKVTDPLSNYSQTTYNAFGEASVIRDARGMLTSEAYDRNGRLKTGIADTAGKAITTSYTYNSRGQVLTATDANGKVTTSTYDAAGRLATVKDALGNTTTYTYDGRDNLVAVTDALGGITRTLYDASDRKVATIDALGGVTTYAYDADGHLVTAIEYKNRVGTGSMALQVAMSTLTPLLTTSADDRTTRYAYDDAGRLRFTVDARLHVTEMEYDAAGNVVRTTAYDGVIPGTSYTASGIAGQVASLSGNPRTTRTVYDALGRPIWSIDALGQASFSVRDALGNVVKQIGYSVAYTATGNPTLAAMATWAASSPVTAGAANDRTTRAWYDADGRAIYSIDAQGYVTRTEYDAGGNVTKRTRYTEAYTASDTTTAANLASFYATPTAPQVTQYSYDTAGRLTETLDGEGNKTRVTLSQAGQVLTSTSAADTADAHVVTYTYDDVGRVLTQTVQIGTSPSGSDLVTANTYDAAGNLVKVHDARGNDSYSYYDLLGQQIASRDAESYVTETTYSTFGDVLTVTRHSVRATNTASTTLPAWNWGGLTDDPAATSFEYDTLGQLTRSYDAEIDPSTGLSHIHYYEQYTLGTFGERLSVRNKLGGVSTYTYDKAGNVLTETWPSAITTRTSGGATIAVVNRYEYDAFGNRTRMVEADGAAEMRTTLYAYDKNGQLTTTTGDAVTVYSASLTTSSYTPTQTLTYDARGNVIKSVDADAQTFFYYDRNDRLIAQISPVGTLTTFTYDGNGNKTVEKVYGTAVSLPGTPGGTPPTGSGTVHETRYAYDRANRLISTTIPSLQTGEWNGTSWAFATGDLVSSATYDAGGNIVTETDARGNSIYHWYDALGREVARVDQENYLTSWTRDAEGNVLSERRYADQISPSETFTTATPVSTLVGFADDDPTHDRITDFTYDKMGRRITETRKSVDYVAVDSAGSVTSGTASSVVTYAYNALGQVLTKAEANGDTTSYSYDAAGRLTLEAGQSFTDYTGAAVTPRTSYVYDGLNNLKSTRVQIDATGTNSADRVTSYVYGAGGRLATMTDASGQAHSYGYDKAGRTVLDSYTRVKSDATSVTEGIVTLYDIAGRAVTQTHARLSGSTWLFTSELSGTPAYDATNMAYDAFGQMTGRGVSAAGSTALYQETFDYDAGGRLWRSNTGDGVLRFHVYDKAGNETLTLASAGADLSALTLSNYTASITSTGDTSTTDAVSTVSIYDKRGQGIATREPDRLLATGASTVTITRAKTYNAFGEVLSETDARGYATNYTYNSMGRMLSKAAPQVSITSETGATSNVNPTEYYAYDLSGRLDKVADANGNVTKRALLAGTGHDGSDALVTREFHADTGVFETKYDVFGDARSAINELGSAETRTYDKLGNIDTVTHRGGHLIDHFTYDILGQRTKHWITESGTSTISSIGSYAETIDYDAMGRVVSTVLMGGDTITTSYAWNASLATSGLGTFGGWSKTTTNAASVSMTESQDYFGRTVGKTDYGSHTTSFTFDRAGRQLTQSQTVSSVTATITNSWFNTGLLAATTDADGTGFNSITSTYAYDASGNRTYEGHAGTVWSYYYPSGSTSSSITLQNTSFTYDALNRLTGFVDKDAGGTTRITFANAYDAAGNVMSVSATYPNLAGSGSVTTVKAYKYDAMNRMVVADGVVSGGHTVRGSLGRDIGYDLAGQRVFAAYDATLTGQSWSWIWYPDYDPSTGHHLDVPMDPGVTGDYGYVDATYTGTRREQYSYTADGYLTDTAFADSAYTDNGDGTVTLDPYNYQTAVVRASNGRDALGRVNAYHEYDASGTVTQNRYSIVYNAASQLVSDTVSQVRNESGVLHTYLTSTANTWAAGGRLTAVTADTYRDGSDSAVPDTSTAFSYGWWDDARVTVSTHTPDVSSPGTTFVSTYYYDPLGRLASVDIADGRRRTASFAYTAEGQVLRRDERSAASTNPQDQYLFLGGMQVGFLTNNGNLDPIGQTYTQALSSRSWTQGTGQYRWGTGSGVTQGVYGQGGYDPINPASTDDAASRYTVRSGDTLGSIATSLWGDASLWYMLAEANGLSAASSLVAGQSLAVPNRVTNAHNSSSTFRPYDPNHALGDLSPTTPKTPKKNKCGAFGLIMMVAIAVAVSIVTAGAAVAALSPTVGSIGAGIGSVLGLAGATSVGAGTLIAAGVVGGAVGSLASQGFGIAIGAQTSINWKGVAIAGIAGGIGGGLGWLGGSSKAATAFAGKLGVVGKALTSSGFVGGAVRGIVANVATQGIARATGLQKDFDFLGVALAGLGGGVSAEVGSHIPVHDIAGGIGQGLVSGMAAGIVNAGARSLITGSDFGDNLLAALPDIIGETIGNAIGRGLAMGRAPADTDMIDPFDKRYANQSLDELTQTRINEGAENARRLGGKLAEKTYRIAIKEEPDVAALFRADAQGILDIRAGKGSMSDPANLRLMKRRRATVRLDPDVSTASPTVDEAPTGGPKPLTPIGLDAAQDIVVSDDANFGETVVRTITRAQDRLNQFSPTTRQAVSYGIQVLKLGPVGAVGSWVANKGVEYGMHATGLDKVADDLMTAVGTFLVATASASEIQDNDGRSGEKTAAAADNGNEVHLFTQGLQTLLGVSVFTAVAAKGGAKFFRRSEKPPTSTAERSSSEVAAPPRSAAVARIQRLLGRYPEVIDIRTGLPIPFPSDIGGKIPRSDRVPWGAKERGDFISEWYSRGYETPRGGWAEYDIHHIKPREYGGTNDFWNLTPVARQTHKELNAFWRGFTGL